jgi:hypothetical protein
VFFAGVKTKNRYYNAAEGMAGLTAIALVVLRLAGVIAWSWWWVLAPMWISAAAAVLLWCARGLAMAWPGTRARREG